MRGPRYSLASLEQSLLTSRASDSSNVNEPRRRVMVISLVQVLHLVLPDVLVRAVADHEQLGRRHAPAPDARQQGLGGDRREGCPSPGLKATWRSPH